MCFGLCEYLPSLLTYVPAGAWLREDASVILRYLRYLGVYLVADPLFSAMQMDGDGNFDGLSAMGFSVLHTFDEVSCDAATWTMVPPS